MQPSDGSRRSLTCHSAWTCLRTGTRVVPPPESGEEDETVGTRFGLAALHDSTHKGRLACVLEIVGDHADQPHAQRHRRIP
jgi:hypothetical protein